MTDNILIPQRKHNLKKTKYINSQHMTRICFLMYANKWRCIGNKLVKTFASREWNAFIGFVLHTNQQSGSKTPPRSRPRQRQTYWSISQTYNVCGFEWVTPNWTGTETTSKDQQTTCSMGTNWITRGVIWALIKVYVY